MPTLRLVIDAREARKGSDEFDSSLKKVTRSAQDGVGASKAFGTEVDRVGRAAAKARASINGTSDAAEQANRSSRRAQSGFSRFRDELSRTNEVGSRFVGNLTRIGGALVGIAAARGAVGVLTSFELTMAQVGGVTRATEADFAALEARAREMGATTRFSATEAAEGLLSLSRAGFTAQEGIEALPATLDLAQAGSLGLGEAADYASNILRQFNLQAEETVRVVDTLIAVSNRSNTNVQQLADALKYAGPIAGALGLEVEETAASIGALGDAGIQASLAGTNLRGVFSALLGPTEAALKAIERYGISLDDVNPATNSLIDIFEKFNEAGLSAGDAVEIFGRRNASAALILTGSVKSVQELTDAAALAGGEAEALSRKMDDTLSGSLKNAISITQELVLQLGENGLQPVLRKTVDFFTNVLRVMGGVEEEGEELSSGFKLLALGIQFATTAALTFVAVDIAKSMFAAAKAARLLALEGAKMNKVFLANPWAAAVAGIVAVSAVVYSLTRDFEENRDSLEKLQKTYSDFQASLESTSKARAVYTVSSREDPISDQINNLDRYIRKVEETKRELQVANEERVASGLEYQSNIDTADVFTGELSDFEQIRAVLGIDFPNLKATIKANFEEVQAEADRLRKAYRESSNFFPSSEEELGRFYLTPEAGRGLSFQEANRPQPLVEAERLESLYARQLKEFSEEGSKGRIISPVFERLLDQEIERLSQKKIELEVTLKKNPELDPEAQKRESAFQTEQEKRTKALLERQLEETLLLGQGPQTIREENDRIEARNLLREREIAITDEAVDALTREFRIRRQIAQEADAEALLQTYEDRAEALRRAGGDASKAQIELQKINVQRQIETEFLDLSKEKQDELTEALFRYIDALNEGKQKKRESRSQELLEELQFRVSLTGQTEEQIERELFLRDARKQAYQDGVTDLDAYEAAVGRLYDRLTEEDKVREFVRLWEQAGESIGQSIGDALFSILQDFNNLEDAAKRLFLEIQRIAFDAAVTKPLSQGISSVLAAIGGTFAGGGSAPGTTPGAGTSGTPAAGTVPTAAKGLVVDSPIVQMMASGGVLDRPTRFQAPVGRVVAGEGSTGKEAFFRLENLADGALGIRGTLDGDTRPNTTVVMNVVTQDANSFRKSERQIASRLRRGLN